MIIIDFTNIEYLEKGNEKQKETCKILKALDIFNILKDFNPILVGTIPISINIYNSDLDIICEVYDMDRFESLCIKNFSKYKEFKINTINIKESIIKTFNFIYNDVEVKYWPKALILKSKMGIDIC